MTDTEALRFWSKVDRRGPDECWPWRGGRNPKGYGRYRLNGKAHQAHRLAYETVVGPIPSGLVLDHLCRVRDCVNPTHLEPVTNRENLLRGRGVTAYDANRCVNGHIYTSENSYPRPDRPGHRICKTCRHLFNIGPRREYKARKRAEAAA